jgi:hypothetical protein
MALMTGRGRSTARAALIHQHATAERERLIGQAVSAVVEQAQKARSRSGRARSGHVGGNEDPKRIRARLEDEPPTWP